jgi:hypothetical protein
MRQLTRTASAEPAVRRGAPGSLAGRIFVAALVTGLAAAAFVAEGGHGHSSAARLSAASTALKPAPPKPAPPKSAPPKPATITARGSVTCRSGSAVVGVWLVGLNGGSGWATWTASAAAPQVATFSRSIPAGDWSVHVGCGRSPASWLRASYSGYVSGTPRSFSCDDIPGQEQFGECSA